MAPRADAVVRPPQSTLYRTSDDSAVIAALLRAADAGKQVRRRSLS